MIKRRRRRRYEEEESCEITVTAAKNITNKKWNKYITLKKEALKYLNRKS